MAFIVINGISAYLGPDGLGKCKSYPTANVEDCQEVDAIVAISGGDTPARTAQAIEMYKLGWAPILVFSGAAADKSGPSNAEAMQRQALAEGVPASRIILDETSETTQENADHAINIFEKNHIRSVILVTSAYHQRRAGLEFGKLAGMDVKIINHPVRTDNQWSEWWWLDPTGWYLAVSEMIKIIVFFARGGYSL
ncbi:YdcF family protein [Candidatus Saccharibacteria bacterium]|nr:YdcF family protein [Candidatus Saccharibacteria bacterium]